jgi:hypothetical protein
MAEPQSAGISTSARAMAEGGVVSSLTGNRQGSYGFGFYGPGLPLPPVVDAQPIRQWDFSPGVNTTQTPRHTEPFSFPHLRAFANVELVRMAIETRKDQLEGLDWQIKPRDNKVARSKERDPRCIEIEKFLAKPDGVTPFASFMRALDEDLLALDAPAMECRRTRGGQLLGLELVDGATINLLVDGNGRRPRGPEDDAFQQIIRGVVWANLSNRELIYVPRNIRTNHIYGFGPVEQIIVTINTILRRQSSQLAYFTEGNVPAGLLTAPEGWTNEQIRDLQTWFDQKLAGNIGEQRKLIWGPNGSEYKAFKDAPIKDEFDEWLARLVAYAFSLPPTPFVRQMNKGTANEDQDRSLEEGLEPLKRHRKRWIDDLIGKEFGAEDLEFNYLEEDAIDPGEQSEIDDRALKNGSSVIDEVRDRRGEDPLPDGMGAKPMIYLGDCPIPLDAIEALIERKTNPPAPPPGLGGFDENGDPIEPEAESDEGKPGEGKPPKPGAKKEKDEATPGAGEAGGKKDEPKPAEKLAKAARIPPADALSLSIDRPKALRAKAALAKAIKPILAKAGIDVAAQVERSIEKADRDPQIEAGRLAASLDLKILLGLMDPLEAELEAIGVDMVGLALASIGVDAESDLVDRVAERAVAYAKDRAAELVSIDGDESLIESTRNMLRGVIASGLEENIGRDAIADAIQESMAFSAQRADLIADTEIAMANSHSKAEAWHEVKADGAVMLKQWFASGESGVCDECEANEAQGEIDFDDEFDSGDDMEPAHPGCRCVTTARVIEAEETPEEE